MGITLTEHYFYDKSNILVKFSKVIGRFLSQQAIKALFLHCMKCLTSANFGVFPIQLCVSSPFSLINYTTNRYC